MISWDGSKCYSKAKSLVLSRQELKHHTSILKRCSPSWSSFSVSFTFLDFHFCLLKLIIKYEAWTFSNILTYSRLMQVILLSFWRIRTLLANQWKLFLLFSVYYEKCKIEGIGVLKSIKVAVYGIKGVDLCTDTIKITGAHFSVFLFLSFFLKQI